MLKNRRWLGGIGSSERPSEAGNEYNLQKLIKPVNISLEQPAAELIMKIKDDGGNKGL